MTRDLRDRFGRAHAALRDLARDASVLALAHGVPERRALGFAVRDASFWALALLRGGDALRALCGRSFGTRTLLRMLFHIDVWSADVGGGLRLPHPFCIVIGEGVHVGRDCVLMHNVTLQRGVGTHVGDRCVLGTGAVVLAGAYVGNDATVGARSVVRGEIPRGAVAVGAPARVVWPQLSRTVCA